MSTRRTPQLQLAHRPPPDAVPIPCIFSPSLWIDLSIIFILHTMFIIIGYYIGFLVAVRRRKCRNTPTDRNDVQEDAACAQRVAGGHRLPGIDHAAGLVAGGGVPDGRGWCDGPEGDGSFAGLLAGVVPAVTRGQQRDGKTGNEIEPGRGGLERMETEEALRNGKWCRWKAV